MDEKRSVILNIGTSCFVHCLGCYNHFAASLRHNNRIPESDIIAFAKDCAAEGYEKVTVGGGDPLSREDLPSILEGIFQAGLRVNLDTVGTAFLSEAKTIFFGDLKVPKIDPALIAPYVHHVGIPLDGATSEVAQAFRTGRPTLVEEQPAIVKLLASHSISVCLNTVVSAANLHEVRDIFNTAKDLPLLKWQLFQFMPVGPLGSTNADKFIISPQEFENAVKEVEALNQELGEPLIIQGKSAAARSARYLIVDDSGLAWSPVDDGKNRVEFGNVRDSGGKLVLEAVKNYDSCRALVLERRANSPVLRADRGNRDKLGRDFHLAP